MGLLLLLWGGIALFFMISSNEDLDNSTSIMENVIKSTLLFSVLLTAITELLSCGTALTYTAILCAWAVFGIISLGVLYQQKKLHKAFFILPVQTLKVSAKVLFASHKKMFIYGSILLTCLFLQGLLYPPNNWDSLTYHIPRIIHWISNESVGHYPTHISRQLYQPPFAEFVILHINVLSCSDLFSNTLQWCALFLAGIELWLITGLLGLKTKARIVSCFLLLTLPEAILESTSTQNDLVIAFFVLGGLYFCLKTIKENNSSAFLYFGACLGLGVLTKGIGYIYFAPICLFLGVAMFIKVFKQKMYRFVPTGVAVLAIFFLLNSGHWTRNYNMLGNILGVSSTKQFGNEVHSPLYLLSSISKNIGLHLGPYPVTEISETVLRSLHEAVGIDIDDPKTNYGGSSYKGGRRIAHEDSAPNPVQVCLLVLAFMFFIPRKLLSKKDEVDSYEYAYYAMIFLQFVLFCFYLKWQPWHTRLHLPMIMAGLPAINLCFEQKNEKFLPYLYPVLGGYALVIMLLNMSRPIISIPPVTLPISILDDRAKKYYANRVSLYEEYNEVANWLKQTNSVGLITNGDTWSYPLLTNVYNKKYYVKEILVDNDSKDVFQKEQELEYIVSVKKIEDSFFEYQGQVYVNLDTSNQHIWIYRQKK
jgi:4-amino-4-deoxy-L-arabinose transferase-like glycosyltransferase